MINGAHVIVFSRAVDADRAFFQDVLGFPSVDAGRGWLIFALPALGPGRVAQPVNSSANPLRVAQQRLEAEIHVLLDMAVK